MNDMMKMMLLMNGMQMGTSALQALFAKLNKPDPQPIPPQQVQLMPYDGRTIMSNGQQFIPTGGKR